MTNPFKEWYLSPDSYGFADPEACDIQGDAAVGGSEKETLLNGWRAALRFAIEVAEGYEEDARSANPSAPHAWPATFRLKEALAASTIFRENLNA